MKRSIVSMALLGLALGAVPACQDSVTYSYVQIPVKFDSTVDSGDLGDIAGCTASVMGATSDSTGIAACSLGATRPDLGIVDFSTSRTGVLRFTVEALDPNGVLIASGMTGDVTIVSGETTVAPPLLLTLKRPKPTK